MFTYTMGLYINDSNQLGKNLYTYWYQMDV